MNNPNSRASKEPAGMIDYPETTPNNAMARAARGAVNQMTDEEVQSGWMLQWLEFMPDSLHGKRLALDTNILRSVTGKTSWLLSSKDRFSPKEN